MSEIIAKSHTESKCQYCAGTFHTAWCRNFDGIGFSKELHLLWVYIPLMCYVFVLWVYALFIVYSSLGKLAFETSRFQRVQSRLPSFPAIIYVVHFLRQIHEAIKAIMICFPHRYWIFDIYNILGSTKQFINDIILQYYLLWIVFVQ